MEKEIIAALLLAAMAASGCVSDNGVSGGGVQLNFFIDSPGNPIDGVVRMNSITLGNTSKGTLKTGPANVSAGEVQLSGEYNGRAFDFRFRLEEEQLTDSIDFIVSGEELEAYEMRFSINETKEPLGGSVYLNNKYLGRTANGTLIKKIMELFPGTLTLNGTYNGRPFEFQFIFSRGDMVYYSYDFVVSEAAMQETLFDASGLDAAKTAQEVFRLVNEERMKLGSAPFRWDARLAETAAGYIEQVGTTGEFSHTDREGGNVNRRLVERRIFHITANENLASTGYLAAGTDETAAALKFVSGWMGSPGHRSTIVDRDGLYSHAGAGVWCGQRNCFAAMVFAGMRMRYNFTMPENNCWYFTIYDQSYNFDFDAAARLQVNSTHRLDAYLAADPKASMENCLNMGTPAYVRDYRDTSYIDDVVSVRKGYGIVLSTPHGNDMYVSLDVDYGLSG